MFPFRPILLLLPLGILLPSCEQQSAKAEARPEPIIHEDLKDNQLPGAPSTFLAAADQSPVHWQRWDPDILTKAKDSQRLIFAVIGSSRYPGCFEAMRVIDDRASIVRRLNDEFVPVLVDLDICRETSLLASILSPETGQPVSFPFFLVISHEGAPVTWQPLHYSSPEDVLDFFDNSLDVISRLWNDPEYVLKDSATKIQMRKSRLPKPDPRINEPAERLVAFQTGIRRINSFYDEDIQTLAGAGGLFPFGLLDALALATTSDALPESATEKSQEALNGILGELLNSAMIDPLDGGVYASRRGNSWNLPSFHRNCATQAKAARVFARIHSLTGHPGALEVARNAVEFAEANYRTQNGLFSLTGKPSSAPDLEWLWKEEELKSTLSEKEFNLWKQLSDIRSLGNIPSEAAPTGRLFRLNSLRIQRPLDLAAERAGLSQNEASTLFESGRKKLLKGRDSRMTPPRHDSNPSASANFRMVSAYSALFTATGDRSYLDRALALGKKCRTSFAGSRFLNERPGESAEVMSDGRAFTYALATQAALDLGAVTLEDEWYQWARDMSTLLGEHFIIDGERLVEARESSRVVDLNFEDRVMTFGESTSGLLRVNLVRLGALGFQIPPALRPWAESLPDLRNYPIVHTDVLRALALETGSSTIIVGNKAPSEMRERVSALPLESYVRRDSETAGAAVELRGADGTRKTVTSLGELQALVDGQN